MIAPDLPGFGVTDPLPRPSFQAYLDWLNALLESNRLIDRLRLIGNSFGGGLALVRSRAPRRSLAAGARRWRRRARCARLSGLSDFVFEQVRRRAYSPAGLKRMIHDEALLSADLIARSQKASYGFVAAMRQLATTTPPTLRTSICPTLVVWGEHDRLSSPQAGRALAESIPGARFHLIKNAGHLPQLDPPGAFNELVLKFLFTSAV